MLHQLTSVTAFLPRGDDGPSVAALPTVTYMTAAPHRSNIQCIAVPQMGSAALLRPAFRDLPKAGWPTTMKADANDYLNGSRTVVSGVRAHAPHATRGAAWECASAGARQARGHSFERPDTLLLGCGID